LQFDEDDQLPKSICHSCTDTIKAFDNLYAITKQSNEKLLKILEREENFIAEALRINFRDETQDDGSDKSLSIETDLAKDIDRILAMTQLDDNYTTQVFNCDFCSQQPPLSTLSELNEHLKSAHIDLVFHCETCDNFIDRNSLIEHMMQHLKEIKDNTQNNTTALPSANENNPEKGVTVISRNVDDSQNDENSGKNNADEQQILPVVENVIEEKNQNVAMMSDDDEDEANIPKKDKSNLLKEAGSNVKFLKKCHYCPKLFSNRSGRLYHQEQAHFNRRRFLCDQCESSFGLKQTLMNHIRNKHSNNVRSFHCDLCDKTYKTKSALHNHKVYHSKDEPRYSCNYCTKKFHFNFLLQQHETIHLGLAKSYDCDVCKKSFNTRNKLTKHRGIHDDNQFACQKDGCNFKGNLKRYLIAHMKRMHS
jgi:hypothetical protein